MHKSPIAIDDNLGDSFAENIVVIGLGYVGLTFSLFLTASGKTVYGIETNIDTANSLANGSTTIRDDGLESALMLALKQNKLKINSNLNNLVGRSVYIITVGTPIDSDNSKHSQISAVEEFLLTHVKNGDLIILRSTVSIGTSQKLSDALLAKTGLNIFVAMCPERTIEGRALEELRSLPQIVGGVNSESSLEAEEFFVRLGVEPIIVEHANAAEFIKLISNTYRDLNFAFANEIAIIASVFGISAHDSIEAANYKYPRSKISLPGLTGGPCLEKDPLILAMSASERGVEAKLSKVSREVNSSTTSIAIENIKASRFFNLRERHNFLVLGVAFKGKPETADTRGSLAYQLVHELQGKFSGCKVVCWDPLVADDEMLVMVEDLSLAIHQADVIFIQHNSERLLSELKNYSKTVIQANVIVYDFWNSVSKSDLPANCHLMVFGNQAT